MESCLASGPLFTEPRAGARQTTGGGVGGSERRQEVPVGRPASRQWVGARKALREGLREGRLMSQIGCEPGQRAPEAPRPTVAG